MQLFIGHLYKLKDGAEPACGHAKYRTDYLQILGFDLTDSTVLVRPDGFSESADFWANGDDLEPQE